MLLVQRRFMKRQYLWQNNTGETLQAVGLFPFVLYNTNSEHVLYATRFINDEALACELAGYFFLDMKQNDTAIHYFLQAHEKYHDWGAVAKSNALFAFVQRAFGVTSNLSPVLSTSPVYSAPTHQDGHDDRNRRKRRDM